MQLQVVLLARRLFAMSANGRPKKLKKSWVDDDAVTESTRVPESTIGDDASDDSVGSMVTESTGTSKTCKCLTNGQRSNKWKERRRAKHLEHVMKKKAAEGGTFTPIVDQDAHREQQRQAMLSRATGSVGLTPALLRRLAEDRPRTLPCLGPVAENGDPGIAAGTKRKIQEVLDDLDRQQLSSEELVKGYVHNTKAFWEAKFVSRDGVAPPPASVEIEENRIIEDRGGDKYCRLCQKWATPGHRASTGHTARIIEMASHSVMFGPCESLRRYEPELHGMPGPCTVSKFRQFWGDKIDTRFGYNGYLSLPITCSCS